MEVGRQRHLGEAVALVGRDDRRQRRAAQLLGQLFIAGPHPGAGIDDEHGHLRVGEPGARLLADRAGQRIPVLEVHPARVDQLELAPVPLAVQLSAIARDPGALVHHSLPPAGETVDERGLAHVGVADDCDLHAASV